MTAQADLDRAPGKPPGHDARERALARAEGLELLGPLSGSGYQRQQFLVRRGDGQTLQMTPLLYAVLEAVDGRRDNAEVARRVSAKIGREAAPEDIAYLAEKKLRPLGVLRAADGSQPEVARSNPLLALRWRFVVSNPRVTRRITRPFAVLFRPYVALPMLVIFALASGWLLLDKGLASATHQALYQPGVLLLIFALAIASAGFHEFGHAAACRYGGATPGAMGVGLYLVWPAFYTEVSDCYRLGRWGRVRVDVGGLYFNAIFAVGMVAVWALTRWDALLLLIPAQLLQMLRQLLPFVRFDGYHILADLTGVPDLFAHMKPTLLGLLPSRWRRRGPQPLKRWARVVVTLWVLLVIPVLLLSLVVMVKVLPRIALTAWDSLGQQADVLATNWAQAAWAEVGVRLVSMFTIALPLVSMTYLLGRIVYRTGRKVWTATSGHRVRRGLAVGAGLGAAVALAWFWWPEGQYRPITPQERGTLIDTLLPTAAASPERMTLALAHLGAPQALYPGSPGATAQIAPTFHQVAGPDVVLEDDAGELTPRLGLVLTPRLEEGASTAPASAGEPIVLLAPEAGFSSANLTADQAQQMVDEAGLEAAEPLTAQAPTGTRGAAEDPGWVFPFSPPREPRPQDNQSVAVNAEDGGTLYDVNFAMVWVTDGESVAVDQRNEAYALASCRDCTTVAVAFQVVLVVGQADVIAPENISVAVNYECTACTTYALAVQLVATLTEAPGEEVMSEFDAIWSRAQEMEAAVSMMSLDEIHAQIASIEAAILEVLDGGEGGLEAEGDTAASGDAGVVAAPTEEPTDSATELATDSASASPTPSASPTSSPSAAPTASPTPTPTPTPTRTTQPTEATPTETAGPQTSPSAEPSEPSEASEPAATPGSEDASESGGTTTESSGDPAEATPSEPSS